MSTETAKTAEKFANISGNKSDFVTKHGRKYFHKGLAYDLAIIDRPTAEALANDPSCRFLQWSAQDKRPKDQEQPLPLGTPANAAAAKSEPGK